MGALCIPTLRLLKWLAQCHVGLSSSFYPLLGVQPSCKKAEEVLFQCIPSDWMHC